ncbi:thiamine pyrophosphate-binding protein [Pseudoclavibacter soli]|uniref:thiamine pyrophosphate-binding protein n=1 Tax=Pseudoclavibacter soli TaxID=452623 RepID=UPI000402ED23|nr:thiamine pyrophosphate-binding protein [Pseudoclavibacter soli]
MSVAASSEFAVELLAALVARGLTDVVVSPGSRSQALALAAAEFERAGLVRLTVRIDEREAGFVALGLSKATGRAPAVITTSGSAVGNLMPAVMEAARGGDPLLLLTADRPAQMRGTGANQTTAQAGMFGAFAQLALDIPVAEYESAPAAAATRLADHVQGVTGPVQLNLQFIEPLSGAHGDVGRAVQRARASCGTRHSSARTAMSDAVVTVPAQGTLVVAGQGADAELVRRASDAGVRVIAEVTSAARSRHNVADYRAWLDAGAPGVTHVVVTGLPTLSRQVWRLGLRDDLTLLAVAPAGVEYFDPQHRGRRVDGVRFAGEGERRPPVAPLTSAVAGSADAPLTRALIVGAVWQSAGPNDAVYLASSTMVRVADEASGASRLPVYAHRGLAGIDGTLSVATGVATGRGRGTLRVLVGDLAFAHDAGGLLRPQCEPEPALQVIVVNDHGGSIFAGLEVAGADPDLFDRVVRTPQPIDVAGLARAYGWRYAAVTTVGQLRLELVSAQPGIIEVQLPPLPSRREHEEHHG